MKFSTKSRYALRLMAELARYAPGTTVSLKEISERQNLSLKYLEQIVTPLARVDEAGNLYFDGGVFPWKLADDFAEDKRWGYPKWKVLLGRLTGKGRKS